MHFAFFAIEPELIFLIVVFEPERFFHFTQCPSWTRLPKTSKYGDGARIFENGVKYVKDNIL